MPSTDASRIAVISGASAGIGEALARVLAGKNWRLVLNARRVERLEALARDLSEGAPEPRIAVVPGDATEQGVIETMLDAASERFGAEADTVVVNAGRGLSGSVVTSDPAEWEQMVRLNVLGAAHLMRAAAQRMVGAAPDPESDADADAWRAVHRDIVVIGSTVGRHISPFSSMYGATKFAVNSMAEAMRRELAPKGIRVTLIEPGIVRSEFQDAAGYDPEDFGRFMRRVGPVLDPEDVARTVAFTLQQPPHVHVSDVLIRPTRQDYP